MRKKALNFQIFTMLIVLVAMALVSCSPSIVTHSVKSKKVDLNQYRTFAWAIPARTESATEYSEKRYGFTIIDLVNSELFKKGFVIDTVNPDAIFVFDTRIDEKVEYTQAPTVSVGVGVGGYGGYGGYYYGGYSAPIAGGEVTSHIYYEGMLFLYMYEPKGQKLLWKGWAEERLTYDRDIYADLQKAIKDMFIRFPVKHK